MIETIRQFHCRHCNYIKRLKPDETIKICPGCGHKEGEYAFEHTVGKKPYSIIGTPTNENQRYY